MRGKKKQPIIIGIDLGTSTTEAAVYRDGKPILIPNPEGNVITPSVVGLDESGNWVVGERARAQMLLAPERTAAEVKRKTGTGTTITMNNVEYQPVELQSRLLSYVRSYASAWLGENVTRAVISVPAYFNNIQRQETIQAGEMAGLEVDRIINEPTAASLSYGIDHMEEESHVLVCDLGGGTFDVTLLEMFSGVLEVKASSGDNHLGGKDFDKVIIEELIGRFEKKNSVKIRGDLTAMVRIRDEAEKCKIALSTEPSYRVLLPALAVKKGQPLEMDETVTAEEFEALAAGLISRMHGPIDRVLEDGGVDDEDIDKVLLVGGSTRMPIVQKDLRAYLGRELSTAVNPDYAVSEGAAIQAGIIRGDISEEEGIIMTDVCPFSLGIRTADDGEGNRMSVIIPRNTTIPVTRTEQYKPVFPWQDRVEIDVRQGESDLANHNLSLGKFMFSGFPTRSRKVEAFDVEFTYDMNGMLHVRAVLLSTGKEMNVDIDTRDVEDMLEDVSDWQSAPRAKGCRSVIRTAERMLENMEDMDDREELEMAVYALKVALIHDEELQVESEKEELESLIEDIRGRDY